MPNEIPNKTTSATITESWMTGLGNLTPEEPKPTNPQPTQEPKPTETPETKTQITPKETPTTSTEPPPTSEDGEEKWPRSAKDWDAFKAKRREKETALTKERDTIKQERDALNKEIEALRKSGPSTELDSLKQERDELSEKLRLVSIENHPKFKSYFGGKVNAQVEMAKRIVGKDKADEVARLLNMPDSEMRTQGIEQFVSELDGFKQARLGTVLNAIEEIGVERNNEIERAKQDYESLSARAKAEGEKSAKERHEKNLQAFDENLKRATDPKEGLFTFQKRDGEEEWNKGVDQRIEVAKNLIFGKNDQDTLLKAAFAAVSFPAILSSHEKLHEENKSLKAQIESLKAATPKFAGGGEAKTGTVDSSPARPGATPHQVASSWMKGLPRLGEGGTGQE